MNHKEKWRYFMENMQNVYENLAVHLDRLPAGFPRTPSGVEMRILKRLFTPEEAALAQLMTLKPETAKKVAERTGHEEQDLAPRLEAMARKGLIFRLRKGDAARYMAAQFVVGIWEYHVNDLDPELIQDVNEYLPHLFQAANRPRTPQLRTIPIARALTPEQTIMPYEEAQRIIDQQEKIAVAPCICRREHQMVGKGCDKPLEGCLVFGAAASYYEENGLGRSIDHAEAHRILQQAEETGLVLQPSNAQNVANICTCCGCCCQILKNLKRLPKPADCVASNYYAEVEADACIGCEICLERCQMEAIAMQEGRAVVNRDRCIGCGLCVPTCDAQAIRLHTKEAGERQEPPAHLSDTYLRIAQERLQPGKTR
jgi:Na+-translocating ferredoxin:NAD+ oxidoreductase subunit B